MTKKKPIEDWLAEISPTEFGSYKRLQHLFRWLALATLMAGTATTLVFALMVKISFPLGYSIILVAPMLALFFLVWNSMDNTSRKLSNYYERIFAGVTAREKKLLYIFNCFRGSDLLHRHMKEERKHHAKK